MSNPLNRIELRSFIGLLLLVTLAFLWILQPFFGALFWAYALTVLLHPMQKKYLSRLGDRPNTKAIITLLAGLILMILPIIFIATSFTAQVTDIVQMVESGKINPQHYVTKAESHIPQLDSWLSKVGSSVSDVQLRLIELAKTASESLPRYTVYIGQNAFSFAMNFLLMLYLAFFFLRDGSKIIDIFVDAFPMRDKTERTLIDKISEVTHATIKGNFVVACVQGGLGGVIFAILGISGPLLWGVVMVFASLLPAVGAAIIWAPVAIYLLVTGSIIKGIALIVLGVGVIGLVDNFLRPMLVGRDTGLPDYLVLLSTLGGLSILGLNGFVMGPLIAALFMATWEIFMKEININQQMKSISGDSLEPETQEKRQAAESNDVQQTEID